MDDAARALKNALAGLGEATPSEALDRFAREHGLSLAELRVALGGSGRSSPVSRDLRSGETFFFGADEDADGAEPIAPEERYELGPVLGVGGMGEVRRVRDHRLGRDVAMKLARWDRQDEQSTLRFVEEAQAMSRLQHPGILPVYDMDRLPDGRLYLTMREVEGESFERVVERLHGVVAEEGWSARVNGWSVHRAVDVVRRAAEAVGYAHAQGIVHRDLKPANILVGAFGEVQVVDWGLAKELANDPEAVDEAEPMGRVATLVGTPAYMAPEQARRSQSGVGPPADVYALGCVLYELLVGGPPFDDADLRTLVQARLTEEVPVSPPRSRLPSPPVELWQICRTAVARDPGRRYANGGEMGEALLRWLDGHARQERARLVVAEANALTPRAQELREAASGLRGRAAEVLAGVAPWAPVDQKRAGWCLEDEAERLEQEARNAEILRIHTLHAALNHDPDLTEAHEALADHYHRELVASEARRDRDAAAEAETLLRLHDRGKHARLLAGDGVLTLVTEPAGAEALLYRYESRDRQLVPVFVRSLGLTPCIEERLPRGSYLVELRKAGFDAVRYPVFIERAAHWDGVRPGDAEPTAIVLPPNGALGPDDVLIPPGWTWTGGDGEAVESLPARRLWLDGFVIRRFPVTNREYLAALDAMIQEGREDLAMLAAPRERPGGVDEQGALIYGRREDGGFELRPDADGDCWDPDWPVMMVDWRAASTFARWIAESTGRPWRLVGELEREKAGRGADGRLFPWGDFLDPSLCCIREAHPGRWLVQPVDRFPSDQSCYGVRGLAGNVADWCADAYWPEGPPVRGGLVLPQEGAAARMRVHRGGRWNSSSRSARLANRAGSEPSVRGFFLGMRLACSYPW